MDGSLDIPIYKSMDRLTHNEVLALEMIAHAEGNCWAEDVMDKRIERITRLIKLGWSDDTRNDRYFGKGHSLELRVTTVPTMFQGKPITTGIVEDD